MTEIKPDSLTNIVITRFLPRHSSGEA